MFDQFRTALIGGEAARSAAFKIGEFDYLVDKPFSVSCFVNPNATEHFTLVNCGWDWYDLPIHNDVRKAVDSDKSINSTVIYINAKHVLFWVKELLKYHQIKNIVVLAEDVPEKDAREMVYLAEKHKVNIVGPSSTGIIVGGHGRLGEIGGDWNNLNLCKLDRAGSVGLITKSGGMSGELLWQISRHSDGVSTAIQIGGDAFPTTDFVWWLEKFADDPQTKVVVLAGEAGGNLEERAAVWYKSYYGDRIKYSGNKFKLIAVISGKFLEQMPKGQKFGHAGAKLEESGFGSARQKIEALRKARVEVVELEELGDRLKSI